MRNITSSLFLFFVLQMPILATGQEIIPLDALIEQVLEQNLDIEIVRKNIDVAQIQASKAAAGQLPRVDAVGSVTYQNSSTKIDFATDAIPAVDQKGAQSWLYNASVQATYNIFDGYRGKYTFELLGKQLDLANLQTLLLSEGILIQVVNLYTNLISLQEQEQTIHESIETSQDRERRTRLLVDFGQTNRVDLLDARVSLNQDSALLIQVQNQGANLRLQMNRLAGWEPERQWQPQDSLPLNESLQLPDLWQKTLASNIEYQLAQWELEVGDLEIKQSEASFYPLVQLAASYGYNRQTSEASFLEAQRTIGPSGTINVQMPIYDGKLRKQQLEVARIQKEISVMTVDRLSQDLERDLHIAFTDYQQALHLWRLQQENVLAAQLNLNQNREALEKGQINSLQFRTAQLNWQRAKEQVILARNQAKIGELELMRISGQLLGGN
ncbi:MAG: TolC family protein [Saprospiraceae bacterium]|nr:TolC family protein [Saprospiraceae bacterium]